MPDRLPQVLAALMLLAVALLLPAGNALAQQTSPFARPPAAAGTANAAPAAVSEPSAWRRLMSEVRQIQSKLYRQLAKSVRALKKDYSLPTSLGLIAVSLLYGVFHAVGPGHGKAVISAYLLANQRAVRQGVILALLSSFMQGVTAVVLVLGGASLFNLAGQRLMDSAWSLEQVSYGLIALIGAVMLWRLATGRGHHHHGDEGDGHHHHGHDHGHDPHHVHDEHCGHVHMPGPEQLDGEPLTLRRALPIILAVGIRPCGGALIVLVFALANGLVLAGIGATFAMSLGTGFTVSVLAILTLTSRRLATRFAARDMRWAGWLETGLKIAAALALLAFGLLFLFASFDQPRSPFGI